VDCADSGAHFVIAVLLPESQLHGTEQKSFYPPIPKQNVYF
jgi:hypothetical protein